MEKYIELRRTHEGIPTIERMHDEVSYRCEEASRIKHGDIFSTFRGAGVEQTSKPKCHLSGPLSMKIEENWKLAQLLPTLPCLLSHVFAISIVLLEELSKQYSNNGSFTITG